MREVENLLAERGIVVTYETVRCWANKFDPAVAANIRHKRGRADCVWHLDKMVVRINGVRMLRWRAVDKEGEVLVQKRRHKAATLKLLGKLLMNQGAVPESIVTDGLKSYPAAMKIRVVPTGINPVDYPTTIERRIHTFPFGDESEKCSASSHRAKLSVSFQPTQRSTIPSIPNVTSSPERQCEPIETALSPSGKLRPLQMDELSGQRLSASSIR